jgi:hypothetical protein
VKWIQTAGAVLELIGLICAAFGFRQTWYEYARGERFLEPMLRPVTSRARAVQNRLRKLLRRPGKPQVVQAGAAAAIGIAGSVTARVGWGPPPDPATDLAAYAAVVTQRINELHQKVQQQRDDLAAETEARKTAIATHRLRSRARLTRCVRCPVRWPWAGCGSRRSAGRSCSSGSSLVR